MYEPVISSRGAQIKESKPDKPFQALIRSLTWHLPLPQVLLLHLFQAPLHNTSKRRTALNTRQDPRVEPSLLLDLGPINHVPPRLRIRKLTAHTTHTSAVLAKPGILPGVQAQNRDQIRATGSRRLELLALEPGRAALQEPPAVVQTLGRATDSSLRIDLLAAPVSARVGGTGEVSGHDAERDGLAGQLGADEPDETGTEHGHGGADHFVAQSVDGAKVLVDVVEQLVAHLDGLGREVVEEEVVVVRHGGVVEDVGELRVAGGGEDDGFGVFLLKVGAYLGA